jgi:hypothetical protein
MADHRLVRQVLLGRADAEDVSVHDIVGWRPVHVGASPDMVQRTVSAQRAQLVVGESVAEEFGTQVQAHG